MSKIEDLIKKYNHKTRISFISYLSDILPSVSIYHFSNFLAITFVQISVMDYQLVNKKIDHFIK